MINTLLVGVDFSDGQDITALIVGKMQPDQSIKIINIFYREEPSWMYGRLVREKGGQ